MEKFVQRESGFATRRSSDDVDFNDVFGGPPRRFSIQEVKLRYSFGDTEESEEEIVSSPWSSVNAKPVFGEDGVVARRRHQKSDDFFDDIFRGEESYGSPRIADRDRDSVFGSTPGSRILSPAKPLPPNSEPFGNSLPAQFSLPAKLTKGVEIPTFATNGQHKMDGGPNGFNSFTRFSSLRSPDENPGYRQSLLSHGVPLSREDAPSTVITSDNKENTEKSTKDRRNVDAKGNQFHFSIYTWAGREVPMLFPLVDSKRSASSNGRIESKSSRAMKDRGLSAAAGEALNVKSKMENMGTKNDAKEVQDFSEQKATSQTTQMESEITANNTAVFGGDRKEIKERLISADDIDVQVKTEKEAPLRKEDSLRFELKSIRRIIGGENVSAQEKTGKQVPLKKEESLRFELKSLRKILSDETDAPAKTEEKSLQSEQKSFEQPGNATEVKGNKKRISNGIGDLKTVNGNEQIRNSSINGVVEGPELQAAAAKSEATPGESRVKGKVREFVQIFNQEGESRPKGGFQRSRNSKLKAANGDRKENGVAKDATDANEKATLHDVAAKSDASAKVVENLNKDESQHNSPSYTTRRSFSNQRNGFTAEKFRRDSWIHIENFEDLLEDEYLIQELTDDHETIPENEDLDDTRAIDAKIRQWSFGKKGNIRSLLSTLQFVLWDESGWKPVPLADLIESNAVKRAYQKALLRLHPDKLQQKGAAFHQKYIAEKVFDILQEAWDQFNTLVPL